MIPNFNYSIDQIFYPTLLIFSITIVTSFLITRWPVFSILAGTFKASLYYLYCGVFFKSIHIFNDARIYLEGGIDLFHFGIFRADFSDTILYAGAIAGGNHFGYFLYNTLAFHIFNIGHYAPIAFNILLTLLIGWLGALLAKREFGFSLKQGKILFAILIFHPDILTWSTIANLKDIIALLINILLLFSVSLFFKEYYFKAIVLALSVSFISLFIRFYIPALFTIALILSTIPLRLIKIKPIPIIIISFLALLLYSRLGGQYEFVMQQLGKDFVNPFYGFIRFLLTPIPFNVDPDLLILNFPAIFHWLFAPFIYFGIKKTMKIKTPFMRFFLFYFFIFILLYAIYGELQGPRHRLQIIYAWTLLDFIGVFSVFHLTKLKVYSWEKRLILK